MTVYNDAGCYGNDSSVQAALTAIDNGKFMYMHMWFKLYEYVLVHA